MLAAMRMPSLIVLLVASTVAAVAEATPIPAFDVDAECIAAGGSASFVADCIRREQSAYNYAKWLWHDLSDESRARCARAGQTRALRYTQIEACADKYRNIEAPQRDKANPPSFRY
jgi:hypothetical protein